MDVQEVVFEKKTDTYQINIQKKFRIKGGCRVELCGIDAPKIARGETEFFLSYQKMNRKKKHDQDQTKIHQVLFAKNW